MTSLRRLLFGLATLLVAHAAAHAEAPATAPAPAPAPAAAPAPAGAASAVIDRFHAGLVDVMKQAKELGYEGRRQKLTPLVDASYDLAFMARTAAGRHWRTLDEAQQRRLVEAFSRMTIANYAGRFTGWNDDRFETTGEDDAGQGTRLVHTALHGGDGKTTHLDYRLRGGEDGRWRIIDVFLNGTVSELALRRSEYGTVIERDGFDALVASLEAKVAALEKGEAQD
jgi:phospholipid transport system substrate-binding protein